jgi:hypothetical protein
MTETIVLYRNGKTRVEANAGEGVIYVRATMLRNYGSQCLGPTIEANGRQHIWWKPWTWYNKTIEQAVTEAMAACDQAEASAELARFHLSQAEAMIEGLKAQSDALSSVNDLLGSPSDD